MSDILTPSAAREIILGEPVPESTTYNPLMQVLSVKPLKIGPGSDSGTERFRVVISDGEHMITVMLNTNLNYMVHDGLLSQYVVIKLLEYSMNKTPNAQRRLLILLNLEVVRNDFTEKIGNPKALESSESVQRQQEQPNVQQQQQQEQQQQLARASNTSGGFARGGAQAGRGGRGGRGGASNAAGGRGSDEHHGPLSPIGQLSPYQNKWTIKARVIQKSPIKHWSNQRGEGKLFNVTLMDDSGEIRATGFNEAVDNFYELLQEGKVFYIGRARVNLAKKQFNNVQNDYEIMFERESEVTPCNDQEAVPQLKFKFVPLSEIGNTEKDQMVDVIGIIKDVGEVSSITSKATQKPFAKRELTLVDSTGWSVRLTLWGKQAESFTNDDQPIVACKGVKVGDFQGRNLSMYSSSVMAVNPDIEEAHALKGWFDAEGHSIEYKTYTNASVGNNNSTITIRPDEMKTIAQVKEESIGMSDKQEYFTIKASIQYIKTDTFAYAACQTEGCNKKVIEEGGMWRCEKCDRSFPEPLYRYVLNLTAIDSTNTIWLTAFNDVAEQLVGRSAHELMAIRLREGDANANEEEIKSIFLQVQGTPYTFQCSAKQDTYNDTPRLKTQIRKAIPVDYAVEAMQLASLIEAL